MGKEVLISGEPFVRVLDGSLAVGTSPINHAPAALSRGIEVVSYDTNTEPVYLSHRSNVTADETPTGGFRLVPGAGVFFPAMDMADVFFVSASGSQTISFLGY